MAALRAEDIADMIIATLRHLGKGHYQQIAQNYTDYEVMGSLFKKDKMVLDSGYGIQRSLLTKLEGNARHVGLHHQDSPAIADVLDQLTIPWVHATTNWSYEIREHLMNRGEAKIVDMVKAREDSAWIEFIEFMEEAFFATPSSSNSLLPYGLRYWIVKNATEGFNGGVPTGFSTVGGIDPATVTNWKNYTVQYATVSEDDLIAKLRTMARKIRFKSPVDVPDFRKGNGQRFRIMMNEATIAAMERLARSQNDQLGRDLAPMDDKSTFKGNKLRYVPWLDGDSTDPLYFADMSVFYPVVLKGDVFRRTVSSKLGGQHNSVSVHTDLSYNYLSVDRRRCGVAYV